MGDSINKVKTEQFSTGTGILKVYSTGTGNLIFLGNPHSNRPIYYLIKMEFQITIAQLEAIG